MDRETVIAESRLKPGDLEVLEMLRGYDHPPTMAEVSRRVGLTRQAIFRRIVKLERAGLVKRIGGPRGTQVTQKGRRWAA